MSKKLLILLFTFVLALVGCTNEQAAPTKPAEKTPEAKPVSASNATLPKDIDVALIMQMSIGTFSSQYINGVTEQVESFGGNVKVYNADNDLSKMASYVDTATTQGVDVILIDHGRADALKEPVQRALDKGIKVVAFDNDLTNEGVTVIDQDDYSLAWRSLKALAEDLDGEGNIVTIWVGGFTPMERRHTIYDAFLKRYPGITEVAKFGSATNNTALDTQSQMEAILKKYPEGEIDAVFAMWDEFAKGASRAIKQAGRDEIAVYGIDLSDEDLQLMQEDGSPWKVTAATDPAEIGRIQVRYAYQKLAGEETPSIHSVDPYLVDRDVLPDEKVTMDDLGQYVPNWGASDAAWSDWMKGTD
ncbi:sugar ABC transporter substrate-binding protein [Exiguobacterium mexicanum]|uniref:sugar ABC transporter substrate-binding protein n=1 Tax=Exiguobacterium mexicanum TaxID=340146 RepID=UPI0037C16750